MAGFESLPRDKACSDTQRLALDRLDLWLLIIEKETGAVEDEDVELHQRLHELIENFWHT